MKKFDWNHPVTRKDFVILWGLLFGIAMVFYAIQIVIIYRDNIKTWIKRKVEKIKSKLPWCA